MDTLRIGQGYDMHRLVPGRALVLGGVRIPSEKGAEGHSDADVLLHATCDALLGALALGDIGQHFPDTDPKYKGIDSRELLKSVYKKVSDENYQLSNMDATICLEKPKIAAHIDKIRAEIATLLHTDVKNISVKATTGEKIGTIGREEGLSAHVSLLLHKII